MKKSKKAKFADHIIRFTATQFWSNIQQVAINGKVNWINQITLIGVSTGEFSAIKCILSFSDNRDVLPSYSSANETIKLNFPYDQYSVILHFIQTANRIHVHYEDLGPEKIIRANLHCDGSPILGIYSPESNIKVKSKKSRKGI